MNTADEVDEMFSLDRFIWKFEIQTMFVIYIDPKPPKC